MKDEHFNHAARLRLGIRPFDDTRTCQCGRQLALEPCHFMSCASLLKTMTLRHNKILFNIAQVAAMLHVPVKIEPRVDNKDTRRADGLLIMQEKTIAINVSVTHPWAKSETTMAMVSLQNAFLPMWSNARETVTKAYFIRSPLPFHNRRALPE